MRKDSIDDRVKTKVVSGIEKEVGDAFRGGRHGMLYVNDAELWVMY